MSARPPWRGYVNMITYGVDLSGPVRPEKVAAVADSLMEERSATKPLSVYHSAATDAVDSDEQLEPNVRDFLRQLLDELDRRRPWPDPPFLFRDAREWSQLQAASAVGRIPLTKDQIHRHLGRGLQPISVGERVELVLLIQLRTGQTVGIRSRNPRTPDSPEVITAADPATAISDFRELTGLPVD